ncbi:MAG: carboxy-S-adenosyl-L-methionine synthase CmoA [Desulfobacteraceae bacterium]
MQKDQIFARKMDRVSPFEFNEQVTLAFDDMLARSVPLYHESIKQQAELGCHFFQPGTKIYDLGCSNGNLGVMMAECFKSRRFSMTGVDSSAPMIETYGNRIKHRSFEKNIKLVCDLAEHIEISNASVVVVNLTLQFIPPEKRDCLVKKIYNGLVSNGILLLTEKITHTHPLLADLQITWYQNFKKKNGYSDLEISQKRDALEKVLIPETIEKHENRLKKAGFSHMDIWLKWFNFASMIAVK